MPAACRLTACLLLAALLGLGCSRAQTRVMEVTAYGPSGKDNGYTRGSWKYLKLDVWNRYVNYGPRKGQKYTGRTASGGRLRQYNPGLVSLDSLQRPWMIPLRVALFPWLLLPHDGVIAADTRYYPFGTRMHVPGYGWGRVEDVGGAIKGPDRLDIFFRFQRQADAWGRQHVEVKIYPTED